MLNQKAILFLVATVAPFFVSSCSPQASKTHDVSAALRRINPEELLRHVEVLSSDAFESRAPSSPGEAKTVRY